MELLRAIVQQKDSLIETLVIEIKELSGHKPRMEELQKALQENKSAYNKLKAEYTKLAMATSGVGKSQTSLSEEDSRNFYKQVLAQEQWEQVRTLPQY